MCCQIQGNVGVGDDEPLEAQLTDMRDLIKRDRSHPSVMAWSFCNEGECNVPADSNPFRQTSYEFDGTRDVTQNYLAEFNGDGQYLDIQVREGQCGSAGHVSKPYRNSYLSHNLRLVTLFLLYLQGFSHKSGSIFDTFHAAHPTQPMMATECCSCMSQRGVDTDACPEPKDGGCVGYEQAGLPNGTFYNNNIGKCTADQVLASDSREFVTGTFVWSGFDCESSQVLLQLVPQLLCCATADGGWMGSRCCRRRLQCLLMLVAGAGYRLRRGAWLPAEHQVPRYSI